MKQAASWLLTLGEVVIAVCLIVGWIVLTVTGHAADTWYKAITVAVIGHVLGSPITFPTVP